MYLSIILYISLSFNVYIALFLYFDVSLYFSMYLSSIFLRSHVMFIFLSRNMQEYLSFSHLATSLSPTHTYEHRTCCERWVPCWAPNGWLDKHTSRQIEKNTVLTDQKELFSTYLEGPYLLKCLTNFAIVLHEPSLFFWNFINTTAYHLG